MSSLKTPNNEIGEKSHTTSISSATSTKRMVGNLEPIADTDVTDGDPEKAEKSEKKGLFGSKKEKKPKGPAVPFFSLWRFAAPLDMFMLIVGGICSIAMGALLPSSIIVLGSFLNSSTALIASPGETFDIGTFIPTILIFVYFGCAMLVAGYVSQSFWVMSGENQTRRIRQLYLHSILRQDMGWFDKAEEGSLTTRLAQDTQLIQDGISEKAGQALQSVAQFVAGFVIAFIKGWKLALVLLASLPVLGVVGSLMVLAITKFVNKGQDAYADAGAVAEQVISGIRTVYSFSLQERFQKKYEVQLQKAYKSDVRKGMTIGLGFGSFMLVIFCTYGLAFWYGSRLVIQSELDGGRVLIVFFSMLMGAMALITLPPNVSALGNARGAAYKIFNTIDRQSPIDPFDPNGLKPEKLVGHIEFRNVQFSYPSRLDVPILHDLSIEIKPGMTVAFVGPSGSGKSTTVSLVQRFYDPLAGTVLLDGNNIKNLNVKWLRQHIGVVSQEPVLFNTTIKQNILMGATSEVTESTLVEVCKKANCHSFISKLPKGYDTLVGEHGGMLSGGQKQRIAIARALIKNPQILLLDEATSALDTASERLVQRALDVAASGRTTIVIAHRLSTIKNADLICVMDHGSLVEMGTHDELLAKNGVYHNLVEKQRIKMESEDNLNKGDAEDALFNDRMDDAELQKALEDEIVEIAHQVKDEKTNEVLETRLVLDDTAALKSALLAKRKEEKNEMKLKASQKAPIWRVLMLMRPEWPFLALGCLAAGVAGCIFPIFALIFSRIIVVLLKPKDQISPGPLEGANLYSLVFVLIGVGAFFTFFTQVFSFERSGARMTRRLRAMAFSALMRQEIGFFDEEGHSLGALTSRLATDASKVGDMVTKVWGDIIQLSVTAICGLVIAFVNSWIMTFIILATVPFIGIASFYESRIHKGFEDATKKAYEESGEIAAEAIKEIRTVAALARETFFEDRFAANISRPHKLAQRKAFLASVGFGAHQGFNQFANALGFYAGLRLIASGKVEFQAMFTVLMAVMITAGQLGRSSTFVQTFTKAKFAAINTFELIDRATSIDPDLPGEIPEQMNGDFKFENIEFTYPARPGQPIFTGKFNLEGKKNQTIALVGQSGCGKSTTIGMLQRWYDASGGKVLVDNKDVKSYQLKDGLRKNMALVGQEPVLFDMSVRENILAGTDREVSDAELDEIAKMANIYTFITELPKSYDTRVGDKGSQLSGGQKQRIAIARAFIRRPRILLLDEATSALDSESEKLVQEALDRAIQEGGRTTITIAHRLSSIQNSDKIFVVKDGEIVESGTHFELLALNGVYMNLVRQQDLNALA